MLPTALFAIIATILEGQRFAILLGLVLACLAQAAFGPDGRLLAFCVLSSVAGAFSVRTASSRIDLVRAGAVLSLIEAASGAALAAPGRTAPAEALLAALWGAGNGFVCALLALAILPVLEQALNAPTRFRLMELSDLNAPILKRLLTVAPGTYSHSVTVAHLAESACREIGADTLLARVGAYYHDIGKIEQPEYFVENQAGYNKHDEINPRLSATVIRSHVKLGAEKVRALGLPEGVVDIVSQHHGNAVIAWFFDQAKKAGGEVDPDDFSYPGQPPASKEAAVVMLADSVEAATRTLKRPTASRLEDFIREIIMDKVRDGQLDRSDLTFKDVDTIRNSFTRILAGHFHSRIEYPKLKEQLAMNRAVEVSVEGIGTPALARSGEGLRSRRARPRLGKESWDLSILICDDSFIRGLNRQYRDKDEATDVLSFEQGDSYRDPEGAERFLAGDIVISLDALARNAEEFGISRDEELRRLIAHGILHLSGMDHEDNDPSRPMLLSRRGCSATSPRRAGGHPYYDAAHRKALPPEAGDPEACDGPSATDTVRGRRSATPTSGR